MKKNIGLIINDKTKNIRTVLIRRKKKNKKYNIFYIRRKKYLVHDLNNESKKGDLVLIKKIRPLSKKKHFLIEKILVNILKS